MNKHICEKCSNTIKTTNLIEMIHLENDMEKCFQVIFNPKTNKYNALYYNYRLKFMRQKDFDTKGDAMTQLREYEREYK